MQQQRERVNCGCTQRLLMQRIDSCGANAVMCRVHFLLLDQRQCMQGRAGTWAMWERAGGGGNLNLATQMGPLISTRKQLWAHLLRPGHLKQGLERGARHAARARPMAVIARVRAAREI